MGLLLFLRIIPGVGWWHCSHSCEFTYFMRRSFLIWIARLVGIDRYRIVMEPISEIIFKLI